MTLQAKVRDLLDLIPVENGNIGFMTCAVYDTAWVSMVAKTTQTGRIWLFPECFRYIIESQQDDGGWPAYAADVDGILNTAASLLALKAHQENPYQIVEYPKQDLQRRISSATQSLQRQLQAWDVEKAVHVGFEILVPTLLNLLDDQGISFDFPGHGLLMKLNHAKLSQFKLAYLYSPVKTTALHSLEAFAGKLDYDRVHHHKTFGAYMASPSSTAAVLMYSSKWDDESEEYLRWTLAKGAGRGSGGVPSAFPSPYFEVTWVSSPNKFDLQWQTDHGFIAGLDDSARRRLHRRGSWRGSCQQICQVLEDVDGSTKRPIRVWYVPSPLVDFERSLILLLHFSSFRRSRCG